MTELVILPEGKNPNVKFFLTIDGYKKTLNTFNEVLTTLASSEVALFTVKDSEGSDLTDLAQSILNIRGEA